jgi:hypothetical protein
MDTAYSAYHQHNLLDDDIQAYDAYGTYAPAPDVNFMSQDLSGINMYGALLQSHWDNGGLLLKMLPLPHQPT